ncbi:MAG: radical SAM protein [Deltaproteobacteria bacterium]|nr:radical SAM protein [Deltaproteobacteria bacterium]
MRRVFRKERFGLIVQPPLTKSLVFVSRAGARVSRPLSAPVEAHLSITTACPNDCPHCYESSKKRGVDLGPAHWKGVIETLSRMGVFHCAIGGGEPAIVPWLFDLAAHARTRGMVPNLTTSGAGVTPEWARRSAVFGQVNVSIDGPDGLRGEKVFRQAVAAAGILRRHRGDVGINCVMTRRNFGRLDEVCALAKRLKLTEVELLRFKPAGRAGSLFGSLDLAPDQYASVIPTVRRLMLRHRLRIKLDCSMVPAVASAGIKPRLMEFFGASGCEGGSELCSVDAKGNVHACSFDARPECRADELESRWPSGGAFRRFRRWEEKGAKICLDCDWFETCRGGCHVVARHLTGSWYAPDPSCALAKRS